MTTATNEGEGITLLIAENVNLFRRIFLVGKMNNFLAVGWYSPHTQGFPLRFRRIILGDNPAGLCFVLMDLFPMSFFKLVMIVLLKRYAVGKTFGETGIKAIRDTFFFSTCGL